MRCFFLHAGEKGAERFAERLVFPHGRKLPADGPWDAVIRYGALAPEPAEPVLLGRIAPLLRVKKGQTAGELLRQCGLKTAGRLAAGTGRPGGRGRVWKRPGAAGNLEARGGEAGRPEGADGRRSGGEESRQRAGEIMNRAAERMEETGGDRPSFGAAESGEAARHSAGTAALPSAGPACVWEFRIPVFQLDALAVYARRMAPPGSGVLMRRKERAFRELPEAERHHRASRAVRDAVRAVYTLGLDYGLVTLVSTADGDTLICEVDAEPDLAAPWAERLADAMNRFAAEDWPERPELLLGADPEFVLRGPDGRVVPASRFLERQGKVGCDAVILSGHRVILPLAELRPDPSPDAAGLVQGLRRTMRAAARKLPGGEELAWQAGGMPVKGLPLGGHIHFSGMPLASALLRALDNYCALPLLLLEGEGSHRRRPRYGRLGDCRRKCHGGFEYRPLPSWLASPELAAGVLALARTVALHWRELRQDPLQHPGLRQHYYRGEADPLRPAAAGLWAELESLAAYREQAGELAWLKRALFAAPPPGGLIDAAGDFRAAWGIGPTDYPAACEPPAAAGSRPFTAVSAASQAVLFV